MKIKLFFLLDFLTTYHDKNICYNNIILKILKIGMHLSYFSASNICWQSVSLLLAPDDWCLFMAPETGAGNRQQKLANVSSI